MITGMIKEKKYWRFWVYLIFGIAVFYVIYNVPYCHDEWQWGLDERIELAKTGFKDYNGRYLGNILALIITRSVLAKAVIITGGILGLLGIMEHVISGRGKEEKEKRVFLLLLLIFLLLAIPHTLFAQTYGWPAAFVNFVPPVVLFLIYYYWTEWVYGAKPVGNYKSCHIVLSIPLGIATQLFSEHNTIFTVMYAIWILVLSYIRYKKVYTMHVTYLISAIAGAVIMFSNGAYHNAVADTDGYKHIGFSIGTMLKKFCVEMVDHLFLNNRALNVLFAVSMVVLIVKNRKKGLLTIEMIFVFCGYALYSMWHKICPDWVFVYNSTMNAVINTVLAMLFFLNLCLCVWLNVKDNTKYEICICLLMAMAVSVPLLAADPIGARCFYVSYIFEALALVKIINYLVSRENVDLYYGTVVLVGMTIILGFVYVRIFSEVGQGNRERSDIIETAIEEEQKEITLPILPYSKYYWYTVPPNDLWESRFKEFYHIDQDVVLKFE